MRQTRAVVAAAAAVLSVTALSACAQESEPTPAASGPDACARENLQLKTADMLTIGTSKPAFPPYVIDNDPSNGEGFESAVAYAVAEQLGFSADEVEWTFGKFESFFAPGEKDFDFALNQISISAERDEAVDFSRAYYEASNGVLVLKKGDFADATTLAELEDAKIGVQVATTSLQSVESQIAPTQDVAVFDDTTAAAQALMNGQIDAIVTDLPTALYLSAVEVSGGTVIGQLPADQAVDTWGLVTQEGSALTQCLSDALDELDQSGELQAITDEWMTEYTGAPVLG